MDRRLTYSAIAGFAVAGAALGFHFGDSAIAEINPLYFQGAAVHPRDRGAAVDESMLAATRPRFSDYYGWEEGREALAGCSGCPAVSGREAYADGVQHAVIETGWQVQPQQATYYVIEPAPQQPAAEAGEAAPPAPSDVERYSSYPIEEKPTEAQAAEPSAEPVEVASAEE